MINRRRILHGVIVTFVVIVGLTIGPLVLEARARRLAVMKFELAGGEVRYLAEDIRKAPGVEGWIRSQCGIDVPGDYPYSARISHVKLTDDLLEAICRMDQLVGLRLNGCDVKAAQLQRLECLEGLVDLHLRGSNVSNDQIEFVGAFRKLRFLDVRETGIDQEGVASIHELLPGLHVEFSP